MYGTKEVLRERGGARRLRLWPPMGLAGPPRLLAGQCGAAGRLGAGEQTS